MISITLKITPSLAGALNSGGSDWLVFERELSDTATIGDLFRDIASGNADFRDVIFNPDTGIINDLVVVVLNNTLIQSQSIIKSELSDGDIVILLPVYMGG